MLDCLTMMMQAWGAQPSHLTYNNALGRNGENYDDDGRYGTPLDSCHLIADCFEKFVYRYLKKEKR